MPDEHRPSKKQRELLQFIDGFIKGYGYGPSYREIMRALNYKSVSTVAVHIDNLIAKGHLVKRDNSARSLEVLTTNISDQHQPAAHAHVDMHKQWLVERAQMRIDAYAKKPEDSKRQSIESLIEAVRLLVDHDTADQLQNALIDAA
jgi:repressor LexA